MTYFNNRAFKTTSIVIILVFLQSCTAGDDQFTSDNLAGFWFGLWHGVIAVIALIIHLFNDSVHVYEINNTGGWYDLGFLLGVICVWGGGSHASCKSTSKRIRDKEWEEIADKVELKVMRKLKHWAEEDNNPINDNEIREDWDEIGGKVEKKLKRKIREWAERE